MDSNLVDIQYSEVPRYFNTYLMHSDDESSVCDECAASVFGILICETIVKLGGIYDLFSRVWLLDCDSQCLTLIKPKHSANVNRVSSLNCFAFHPLLYFACCPEFFLIPSPIWSRFFFHAHCTVTVVGNINP